MPKSQPLKDRFWDKLVCGESPPGLEACWLWGGATLPDGYGVIWDGEKRTSGGNAYAERTHVISLRLAGVEIAGLDTHHICGVKKCVNPDHLLQVSHAEHLLMHAMESGSRDDY